MKLLLAEDTKDLNRALKAMLEMQNYTVDSALDGEEALSFIEKNGYDGLILDIMMPKKDGLEVLREIRARHITTPVLMLTAKAEVDDRVTGLEAGADDYLTKPFAMKELVARVHALTRRGHEYADKELSYGDITLRAETGELISENSIRLSQKEVDMLDTFLRNPEKELDCDYFLTHTWSDDRDASSDMVYLYVKYLRDKLDYINSTVTIRGDKGGPYQLMEM
ncbi:MAG TPA: DNA-binding response regulator [Lachnospiraceae bacterium]|jgi:DNA-binding response OmpR family regulator|nr:DNA-binding response regulator [Lachnospiraceae bacterium]HBE08420.1 DNA-binding response regulator [Lachnospiraceae bacterium]